MTKNVDWKGIERKTYRDTQKDGLMEILTGFGMIYIAGLVSGKLSIIFVAMVVIFFNPALEALKRRFTYPRIGYVKLPQEESKVVWNGIVVAILGLFVVVAIVLAFVGEIRQFESWLKWIPALLGIVYVGMFLSLATKSKNIRYYGYALFSVISGFSFSLLKFESWKTGIELYFLSMAGNLIITGFFLLRWFMRTNPLPAEELQLEEAINAN